MSAETYYLVKMLKVNFVYKLSNFNPELANQDFTNWSKTQITNKLQLQRSEWKMYENVRSGSSDIENKGELLKIKVMQITPLVMYLK